MDSCSATSGRVVWQGDSSARRRAFLSFGCHVFLDYSFGFLDESLLESFSLEEQLKSIGVSALELSPSMVVERVFKLFREGLHLQSFFGGRCRREVLCDFGGYSFINLELALVFADFVAKKFDVLKTLILLDFAFVFWMPTSSAFCLSSFKRRPLCSCARVSGILAFVCEVRFAPV